MANHPDQLWRFSYQWKKVCRRSQRAKVKVGKSGGPLLPPFLFIIQRAVSVTCLIRSSGFKASSGLRATEFHPLLAVWPWSSHLTSLSLFHRHSFKYISSFFTVQLKFIIVKGSYASWCYIFAKFSS